MDNLAHEIALIVCRQCSKRDDESEIEFSTRLYDVYNSCLDNVDTLIERANQPDEANRKMIENML